MKTGGSEKGFFPGRGGRVDDSREVDVLREERRFPEGSPHRGEGSGRGGEGDGPAGLSRGPELLRGQPAMEGSRRVQGR